MVPTAYDAACRDEEAQTNKNKEKLLCFFLTIIISPTKIPKTEMFSFPPPKTPPPNPETRHTDITRGNELSEPPDRKL